MPLVVLAGKEYGTGSSRDWAAKGTQAARRAGGDRRELRAHPPQQPGRHGRAAAAVPAGRERRLAGADRREEITIIGVKGGIEPRGDAGGHGEGRGRHRARVHDPRAHRHARGIRGVPPRRHPAVRRPPARQARVARGAAAIIEGMPALTAEMVKAQALSLGFDLCGICRPEAYPELGFLAEWLTRGYAGDMRYLGRTRRVRGDVRHILPSAQSVIVTATNYNTDRPVLDRDRRSRRGADRALRVGRRLPRGRAAAPERALAVDARDASGAVRGDGLRRHRPDPGARLRAARRHRLDRQAHLRHQRAARLVALPVDDPVQPAARAGSAGDRSLRHLHAVSRRVPDRRHRRAVRPRRPALPVVPDDRAPIVPICPALVRRQQRRLPWFATRMAARFQVRGSARCQRVSCELQFWLSGARVRRY